jgi:ABC-type polysaccharide/polyol phosphate transport system ATPase subunit
MLAIKAIDIGKKYEIYNKPSHRLKEFLFLGKRRFHQDFWALRNIYLEVEAGSTVGVIGNNGAGKSTLLKLLTGTTKSTCGELIINGRVSALLELGAGFHPEFSGRDNIYMNCTILGMTKEEIDSKFESIVNFSELGDFIYHPLKIYSSGMYMRRGFSVAISVDPDILIIDEALSVGDEYFRGKCLNKINDFKKYGKTILFVSHDIEMVKNLCDFVILLEKGEIIAQGSADEVADIYLKKVRATEEGRMRLLNTRDKNDGYPRWGSGEIEITEVKMLNAGNEERYVFQTGEKVIITIKYMVKEDVKRPVFGIGLFRSDGTYITGANHLWHRNPEDIERLQEGEEGNIECIIPDFPLLKGNYYLTLYCYNHSLPAPTPIDHVEKAVKFKVIENEINEHGMVSIPTKWKINNKINKF